jgi:hypothetical protein
MLRGLYRLLAPPSGRTMYRHRTRARVYWREKLLTVVEGRRRAHSAPPSHPERKNEEIRSIIAQARHPVPGDI